MVGGSKDERTVYIYVEVGGGSQKRAARTLDSSSPRAAVESGAFTSACAAYAFLENQVYHLPIMSA